VQSASAVLCAVLKLCGVQAGMTNDFNNIDTAVAVWNMASMAQLILCDSRWGNPVSRGSSVHYYVGQLCAACAACTE
jgi:hypothetical protein